MARQQRFEHVTAHRRQPLRPRRAQLLGMGDGGAGATAVIMIRRREHRWRHVVILESLNCATCFEYQAYTHHCSRPNRHRENVTPPRF